MRKRGVVISHRKRLKSKLITSFTDTFLINFLYRSFICICRTILFLFLFPSLGYSLHHKIWTGGTVIGPLNKDKTWVYYVEPQLRLIDSPYIFNQFIFLSGLGYRFKPDWIFFMGPGWLVHKSTEGDTSNEQRLWEQISGDVYTKGLINLNSRTRLEQRKIDLSTQIAVRFRQRLWLRIRWHEHSPYFFSTSDEVLFNLNHPHWVSPYFFEQNRAFIGISRRMSKTTLIDLGYMNQYIHSKMSQRDHVLLVNFSFII